MTWGNEVDIWGYKKEIYSKQWIEVLTKSVCSISVLLNFLEMRGCSQPGPL